MFEDPQRTAAPSIHLLCSPPQSTQAGPVTRSNQLVCWKRRWAGSDLSRKKAWQLLHLCSWKPKTRILISFLKKEKPRELSWRVKRHRQTRVKKACWTCRHSCVSRQLAPAASRAEASFACPLTIVGHKKQVLF